MEKKTYRIEYNYAGIVYVVARDIKEALDTFIKSGYGERNAGSRDVSIKRIILLDQSKETLV